MRWTLATLLLLTLSGVHSSAQAPPAMTPPRVAQLRARLQALFTAIESEWPIAWALQAQFSHVAM